MSDIIATVAREALDRLLARLELALLEVDVLASHLIETGVERRDGTEWRGHGLREATEFIRKRMQLRYRGRE